MNPELMRPRWSARPKSRSGFHEVWSFTAHDPAPQGPQGVQRSIWLRFTVSISDNGFRRVAECWAVTFERHPGRETTKLALRQTQDLSSFASDGPLSIRIGDSELTDTGTRGAIQSKGRSISWDLRFTPRESVGYELVPSSLRRFGILPNALSTVEGDLVSRGFVEVDGTRWEWNEGPAVLNHSNGPRSGRSWVWGHCNTFVSEQGSPVPFVFEGMTASEKIGPIPGPRISSFHFRYQGENHAFHSLRDPLRIRSENTLTEWRFRAERGDLAFQGELRAEHKDFAGLTLEDTDGSLLYCATSRLADLKIHVYRRGKLELTLLAPGTASFEVASREKNPYVSALL